MKKLYVGSMVALLMASLVACDFAEGVDHEFGLKGEAIFIEIDEDTMEKELSDGDDVGNFDLLTVEAKSKREVAFVNAMEGMLKLQDKVVAGEREALKEYLKARNSAIESLGMTSDQNTISDHVAPQFLFTEEDN